MHIGQARDNDSSSFRQFHEGHIADAGCTAVGTQFMSASLRLLVNALLQSSDCMHADDFSQRREKICIFLVQCGPQE